MNKNPRFDPNPSKSADTLRSDIDTTRQRLDETIDAIAARLRGRHLVDEVLHFARKPGDGNDVRRKAEEIRSKIADSTGTAVHTVVDTVKAHPWPTLLIGAGLAWLAYDKQRQARGPGEYESPGPAYDPDFEARREAGFSSSALDESRAAAQGSPPINYTTEASQPAMGTAGEESKLREWKEAAGGKAGELKERVQRGAGELKERARERSAEIGERIHDQASVAYDRARARVSDTVEHHPLESAVACLAAGVIAGLLLPTPRRVDEMAGPTSEKVRRRVRESARDVVERGKHVAQAAAAAARDEAREQGLTPESLRESARAVGDRAREAAGETVRKEGASTTPPASTGQLPPPESSAGARSPDDASSPGF